KEHVGPRLAAELADRILAAEPAFDAPAFTARLARELPPLELKARVAAIADALRDHLPDHYPEYLKDYRDMLAALLPLQRQDGFWNVSLEDVTHYGGKELTGTALFVYGMAYGINKGLIDRKTYLPAAIKAWNALVKDCLHANGFLGFVQGTGKEPKDGQPVTYNSKPDFEDYGLGCFLLAGSEMYKLKP
ncbi:MAG TPA: glycoside hydrolase family 88 protein, partial [Phnomibacter sp.]|nr:glycoside hydrolase family 88 protein [Phnomibacter sp.]